MTCETPIRGKVEPIGNATAGFPIKYHRTAGRLVNLQRCMVPLGRTYVDDKEAISKSLADQVFLKAFNIQSIFTKEDGTENVYEGQAGLIRGERLTEFPNIASRAKKHKLSHTYSHTTVESRFTVVPTTAKHNVSTEELSQNRVLETY